MKEYSVKVFLFAPCLCVSVADSAVLKCPLNFSSLTFAFHACPKAELRIVLGFKSSALINSDSEERHPVAAIYPFRALRPPRDKVQEVAAVPYDVVNTEEARTLAAGNPLSFLHVSRPEIDLPEGTGIYSDDVYAKAKENFDKLRRDCPLEEEDGPSLYLYRLVMGEHTQTGVAACASVDEYDRGRVRKHERTRPDKENDRTRHTLELRAQTGPGFLTYRA